MSASVQPLRSAVPGPAAPAEPAATVLTATGLSLAYGPTVVVDNIDLAIRDRQITAIMGPSGCGKSTLIRALNRTLELIPGARVVAGSIALGGLDLYASDVDPRAVRATVGIIQQKPVCFPMSIARNVLFGATFRFRLPRGERDALVEEALTQAGLWHEVRDRLKSSARHLSGGQQQRLCLARTLAMRPRALLMDEPCSSLDPTATRHIEDLMLELRARLPIVVVTHNLAQARRVADHAVLMVDGRVEDQGPAERVFEHPVSARAADFISGRAG